MNPVQEKLAAFVLKRTLDKKQKQVETLLSGAFKQQDKGTLTPTKMEVVTAKILPLINPKQIEEVKKALVKFGIDSLKSDKLKTATTVLKTAKKVTAVTKSKPTKKSSSSW